MSRTVLVLIEDKEVQFFKEVWNLFPNSELSLSENLDQVLNAHGMYNSFFPGPQVM